MVEWEIVWLIVYIWRDIKALMSVWLSSSLKAKHLRYERINARTFCASTPLRWVPNSNGQSSNSMVSFSTKDEPHGAGIDSHYYWEEGALTMPPTSVLAIEFILFLFSFVEVCCLFVVVGTRAAMTHDRYLHDTTLLTSIHLSRPPKERCIYLLMQLRPDECADQLISKGRNELTPRAHYGY